MNKIRSFMIAILVLLLAAAVYSRQGTPERAPAEAEETTKTRTELLNELSLRTAQLAQEHAKEEYDRYEREYENAKGLFEGVYIIQFFPCKQLHLQT